MEILNPTISLRPMNADEFINFIDYFVPEYAVDLAASYDISNTKALERAQRAVVEYFPEGVETKGHVLLCIVDADSSENLGFLWYQPKENDRSAFIYEFHILPAFQNKGLGKKSLAVLEKTLSKEGFKTIQLRVAPDNAGAKHVYDVSGFKVTGISMSKSIG